MRNDDTNKNLWNHSAAPAPETSALSCDISCDTAIIGGGFTGLSAALHLADAGVDAVVLEAKAIGFGGSGRNVGLVNAGMWMRPDDIIAAVGETTGERLVKDLGDGPAYVFELIGKHGIDCEAIHNGTLHLAVGKEGVAEIETRAAQWQRRGAPVEALSADIAGKLTGASGFAGALLDRRAGTVQPLGYARGLARAAMGAGAKLFTDTPVVSATRDGETIVLKTARGQVRAKKLIIASNAYSGVVPSMNWSDHGQELVPMYYFQFATTPLPPEIVGRIMPEGHGCWDTGLVMTSFRTDKSGRLIFGSIGSLDALGKATHRAFARRAVNALYPFIGNFEFEYWWDGQIGMTRNNLPSFHQPEKNVWSIAGYNGRGISPGTVFGRALAAVSMGNESAMMLPVTPVAGDALRGAKSAFYNIGSMAKHFIDHRLN
ncbi:FAD-binding oxidoreductase [Rhizobium sp. TH2]|uniref:NAD(P)/FAD-dependent oxidoreductase n=1 Tax=Rhizobium sp. TH2 TaxID=2775403 RepID=UPI0021577D8C|nr:FAD-binding oxidoreductase [Rhizobium sp. TH2]UVC06910.1 FAD-binding oxidoreductase [Rhizobium sp. TH2]